LPENSLLLSTNILADAPRGGDQAVTYSDDILATQTMPDFDSQRFAREDVYDREDAKSVTVRQLI
jgi:hypothetical protein